MDWVCRYLWEELEETLEILEREGVLPPLDQLKRDC